MSWCPLKGAFSLPPYISPILPLPIPIEFLASSPSPDAHSSLSFPDSFPLETSVYLTKLGHNSTLVPVGMSVACGVRYTAEGGWEAAGDPRRFDAGGSISD
jgi:hypothetical protein